LELSYHSAEIRAVCFERDKAAAEIGYAAASELGQILADMDAFENFQELSTMFGSRIEDAGMGKKRFQMMEGYSILFISGLPQNLGENAQPTNWPQVYRLMILAIEPIDV
jgi:hypothetical protein